MTDYECAKAFFDRIKTKGFGVRYADYDDNELGSNNYKPDRNQTIELMGADGEFCCIHFYGSGSFYRISGFQNGFWADEVDSKKYL